MLKVTGLHKSYGSEILLDDVSFVLNPGEKAGLVGRNGAGKTTLFKIILGQEEPDEGSVSVPRNYSIGYLSQHMGFAHNTVLDEACSSLPASEDGVDETYKAKRILIGLGLDSDTFALSPLSLSGGYQVRLNLAKALASEPNLLLLDEPTNYLDILSIRWLKRFLTDWKGELLLITHDRDFMDSCITHTVGIHRRKVRKVHGPTQRFYSQILQEEEVYEQTRLNDEKKRKEVERFINRFRAQATRASAVQSRIKALERQGRIERLEDVKELDFEFRPAPFPGKTLMEADGLSFGFGAATPLIKGLSFSVGKRDRIAVIGKNGKGKTTLLNLLANELAPTGGVIKSNQGVETGYFGQTNINRLNLEKTIEEELISAHPDFSRSAARRACGVMMFEDDNALKKIDVLSGGERSRVLLAKLLLKPANLLLLDEPTNHLDMESIDSLIEALTVFEGAVVVVTHSEMMLDALATRLIVFDNGRQSLFEGSYRDFLDKVGWEDERGEARRAPAKAQSQGNKKEARKLRADIVRERVKALGPLKARIAELEGGITGLEGEAERASHELAGASGAGDGQAITRLSKSFHEIRARIDALFDELEKATLEHDSKAREFDLRLEGIG